MTGIEPANKPLCFIPFFFFNFPHITQGNTNGILCKSIGHQFNFYLTDYSFPNNHPSQLFSDNGKPTKQGNYILRH
jgi:hypothetical protein